MHEGKQAEIKNDTFFMDGKPTQHCYFTKDYYWVGANNTINLILIRACSDSFRKTI